MVIANSQIIADNIVNCRKSSYLQFRDLVDCNFFLLQFIVSFTNSFFYKQGANFGNNRF